MDKKVVSGESRYIVCRIRFVSDNKKGYVTAHKLD